MIAGKSEVDVPRFIDPLTALSEQADLALPGNKLKPDLDEIDFFDSTDSSNSDSRFQ
jgi:hypothetical protein